MANKKTNSDLKKFRLKFFKMINIQFVKFIFVGVINTGFSYSVYALLLFMNIEYKLANLGSLILSVIFSFNTQGKLVFNNTNNKLFISFSFCWLLIYLFNIFIIGKLIYFGFNAYQSGVIALIPVTLFSYFIQKLIFLRKIKF